MKKILASLFFVSVCLSAIGQTQTYFWTNGVALAATNYSVGNRTFYLTTNQVKGIDFAVKQWNTQMGLTGTNRLDWKDSLGYAWFFTAEQWGQQAAIAAQADADAKAAVRAIKDKLNADEVTDSQLAQIKAILGL